MRIRFYKIKALFLKDLNLSLKNKNVMAVLILPILFGVLFNFLLFDQLQDHLYIMNMCQNLILATIPLSVQSSMIAEEKEKNTMRTLMLSDLSGLEFLLSKSMVSFLYILVLSTINFFLCDINVELLPAFLLLSLLAGIAIIFFGSMVGILAKDQASASTLSTPFMLILYLPAVFAGFNDIMAMIGKCMPTYALQVMFQNVQNHVDLFCMENLICLGTMLVWIIVGILLFQIAYKKNQRDN